MGCGLGQVQPFRLALLGGTVNWNSVVRSHRGYALPGPAIAMTGGELVAIEKTRDHIVAGNPDQQAHGHNGIRRRAVALPTAAAWQAQLRVNATGPMHEKADLTGLVVDIGDDLLDHGPHDPLLQPGVRRRCTPNSLQVDRKRRERYGRGVRLTWRLVIVSRDAGFDGTDTCECPVPTLLELRCDQPVRGIDCVILTEGTIGGIACRRKVPAQRVAHLVAAQRFLRVGFGRRRDRPRFDDLEDRGLNRIIHPQPTKGDATGLAVVEPATGAAVSWDAMLGPGVTDRELAPAASASHQTRQESVAVLGRAPVLAGWSVVTDHPANRLRTLPVDITLMSTRMQCKPFLARLAAAPRARSAPVVLSGDVRLAVGVCAAVDRVRDHPVDAGIARSAPDDIPVSGPRRQIEAMFMEPEQCLAGAAKFDDLGEHKADRLLHPPIGILLEPIPRLHEADRRGDDQLASARLLVTRRQGTLPEEIQLVFVQAALET